MTKEELAEQHADEITGRHWPDSPDWIEAYNSYLAGYEAAEKKQGWVSVKERLPEDYRLVLAWGDDVIKLVKRQPNSKGWHSVNQKTYWLSDTFSHWMPVPEPPKPEKQ
jgi:hypothetical protein